MPRNTRFIVDRMPELRTKIKNETKLSRDALIRKLYHADKYTIKELGEAYEITPQAIWKIIKDDPDYWDIDKEY